jgi:hypothetical protein
LLDVKRVSDQKGEDRILGVDGLDTGSEPQQMTEPGESPYFSLSLLLLFRLRTLERVAQYQYTQGENLDSPESISFPDLSTRRVPLEP